jgi:hypothetical protein
MMSVLPYVTATGNIDKALRGIQSAATPTSVSQDFVKTILLIPGGSGNQMTSFLKKIGFVNADGSPSSIYRKFRNPSTAGEAAAEALKVGYPQLYIRNEYMHQLSDEKLRGLIIEETGQSDDSSVVSMTLASIKAIKKFAEWSQGNKHGQEHHHEVAAPALATPHTNTSPPPQGNESVGLNLSYTINLNLPATSDIAVFNAIFKSLKENLLRGSNEQG